jgi:hypothetical protein
VLRARAFGLDLTSSFPVPGLEPGPVGALRSVALERTDDAAIEAGWPAEAAERVDERLLPDGRLISAIDVHPERGYLLTGTAFGRFHVAPDGTLVRCAPRPVADWRWQRYLIGQVLPLTALLHGLEAIHASAVERGGRALAISAPSGTGKSSLALHLLLRGARFVSDDCLALEPARDGEGVTAHPGIGIANLRRSAAAGLTRSERLRLGRAVGRGRDFARIALARVEAPVPLAALCLIDRRRRYRRLALRRVAPVDPAVLVATSFSAAVRTPARLVNQIDVFARLARTVPVWRADVPAGVGPAELAAALDERLLGAAASGAA